MNYDHSNIYAAIFQVSAAGTCLGCLLVGLSFLSKVWAFWYRLCHCKEVDPIAILRLNQWYFPSWNRNSTGKGTWTCSLWLGFWYILQPECCSVFSINSREVALSRTFTWSCWSEVFCPLQPGFHWIVFTGHGGDTMGHNVGGTLSTVTWRNIRLLTKTKYSELVDSKEYLQQIWILLHSSLIMQIFPINMKGSAGSFVTLVNWLGSWIVSYAFNFLLMWSTYGKLRQQAEENFGRIVCWCMYVCVYLGRCRNILHLCEHLRDHSCVCGAVSARN